MKSLDKRIQRRVLREGRKPADEGELPDLADQVRQLDDREVEKFSSTLAGEAEVRAERIERALERAAAPPPPPPRPVQGFDEDDL